MFKQFVKTIPAIIILALIVGMSLPAEAKYLPGWNKARQIFLRKAITDPRQPKFIRGALKSQVNRWQRSGKTGFPRLKNPKGYDIGHNPMKRGSINPKDLRFEFSTDNRGRPQRVKARGRKQGFTPRYF